ncbi:MAG: DUF4430 domain-containing protein [Oscillospiraceae bacterium]|nr:DUF4430 domain-containing protein [Oscillospiraceae bacterium]
MKTTKKIMAAMLSASAVLSVSVIAFAEDAPEGHITFYADKSTIGQGLVTEPVTVAFYEGDTGIDLVQRAADVLVADGGYGAYIEGFADVDNGAEIPAEIVAVCPEMTGRNTEGYLCSYDYTAESGWSWFLNGEYSMVGISDYQPEDGDVVTFRFTVYGYGCDLGIDNSSWGGSPALVEAVNTAELAALMASADKTTEEYKSAVQVLGSFGVSQEEIDSAYEALLSAADDNKENVGADKTSPETGADGIAAVCGAAAIACAALIASKKR